MKLFNSTKKKVAAGAVAAAVVASAGIAGAYWTSTGVGGGSATVGTDTPFTVTTQNGTAVSLTPGGPGQSVTVTVENTGEGVQRLQSLAISVADQDGPDDGTAADEWTDGDCSADDFVLEQDANVAAAGGVLTIASIDDELAKDDTHDETVVLKMINRTDVNQDDCKGVTVPLYIAAS